MFQKYKNLGKIYIYRERVCRLISKSAFAFKITSCDLLGILNRIYMFHLSKSKEGRKRKRKTKKEESEKKKTERFSDKRKEERRGDCWFYITNIIPPSPNDGSLKLKRCRVDFVSQQISPSAWITLLSIFSLSLSIYIYIYICQYIYIYIFIDIDRYVYMWYLVF